MNAIIQGQLDRVEAALNTLVSSIESYNPSVPAAIDLLAADSELQEGVQQRKLPLPPCHLLHIVSPTCPKPDLGSVAQHQAHHARILALRSAIEEREQRRRSTLTLLAETRADILSTPVTTFPEKTSRNDVPYTELLDYASRISKYTVPPTFREPPPPPQQPASNAAPTAANGVGGGAVAESREANAVVANGEVVAPQGEEGKGVGEKSLGANEIQWLNQQAQLPFTPWPTEDVIKRGALGQIQ
ncbi:MAG: hypothetical protein L6R35_002588, partial [Caloplaca aegaea]